MTAGLFFLNYWHYRLQKCEEFPTFVIAMNRMNSVIALPGKIFRFYLDGFRSMTVGRKLWVIILIKLFIMFAIMKLFFFPDILERDYDNDHDRAAAVRTTLINR